MNNILKTLFSLPTMLFIVALGLLNFAITDSVTAGDCIKGTPLVAVTPTTLSASAGTPLNYIVKVNNTDFIGCRSSIFRMHAMIPREWLSSTGLPFVGNWTSSFSEPMFNLSAGQQKMLTFTLTSATNATPLSYSFNISTSRLDADRIGRGRATYVVV